MAVSLAERGGEIQRTAVTNIEPISISHRHGQVGQSVVANSNACNPRTTELRVVPFRRSPLIAHDSWWPTPVSFS